MVAVPWPCIPFLSRAMYQATESIPGYPLSIYAVIAIQHALDSMPALNIPLRFPVLCESCVEAGMNEDFLMGGRQHWVGRRCDTLMFSWGYKMLSVSLWTVFILEDVILRWLLQGPLLKNLFKTAGKKHSPTVSPDGSLVLSSGGFQGRTAHLGELEEPMP